MVDYLIIINKPDRLLIIGPNLATPKPDLGAPFGIDLKPAPGLLNHLNISNLIPLIGLQPHIPKKLQPNSPRLISYPPLPKLAFFLLDTSGGLQPNEDCVFCCEG